MNKKKGDFFKGILGLILGIFAITYCSILFHRGYVMTKYPKQVVSFDPEEIIYIHLDKYCPYATMGAKITYGNETSNLTIFSTRPPYTWPCYFDRSDLQSAMLSLKVRRSKKIKIDRKKQVGYAFWPYHLTLILVPMLFLNILMVLLFFAAVVDFLRHLYFKRPSPHGERIEDTEMEQFS